MSEIFKTELKQNPKYPPSGKREKIYHEPNGTEVYVGLLEEKYISCTIHSTVWVFVSKEMIKSPSAITAQ